jgi:hypothetical protein
MSMPTGAPLPAGTDGLEKAYVWLLQARVALGTGDIDGAREFAAAVAQAETRPAAWVARIVGELDRASKGAFASVAERTSRRGFTTV